MVVATPDRIKEKESDLRQATLFNYIPPGAPVKQFNPEGAAWTEAQFRAAAAKFARYIWDPVAYVQDIILRGRTDIIEPHQADIMDLVAQSSRVAIKAANGVGKDTVSAWLIEWFTITRPLSKVPCTSGVFRQIRSMLWSEVNKWSKGSLAAPWLHILDTRMEVKGYQEEWFAEGFTADEEKKAEGYHAHHMLYIITEAKAVRDQIWNAVFKACSGEHNKIFCQSVPGGQIGEFFSIFSKYRSTWKTFTFAAARAVDPTKDPDGQSYRPTTRLVSQASINEKLMRGGEDSPLFQAGVLANFLTQSEDSLIPLSHVERAMSVLQYDRLFPLSVGVHVELGVDVARFGDDSSVITARRGPVIIKKQKEIMKMDTMAVTGEVVAWIKELRPAAVKVDVIGIGSGVVDRLVELTAEAREEEAIIQKKRKQYLDQGTKLSEHIPDPLAVVEIVPVNVGESPDDNEEKQKYKNKRSQYWALIRDKLKAGEIGLQEDPDLAVELTTPRYRFMSDGKLEVESKESIKERGFGSPDKADSLILAFVPWQKGGLNVFF